MSGKKAFRIALVCILLIVTVFAEEGAPGIGVELEKSGQNHFKHQELDQRRLIPMPIPPSTLPPGSSRTPTPAPTPIDLSKTPCADVSALNCVCDSTKCLAVFKKKRKWYGANQFCRKVGWHMAVIISPFDQNLLERLDLRLQNKRYAWFGLRDRKEEGKFLWNGDVPPLFLNWGGQNPPKNTERRDCVGVANDHRWYVLGCHRKFKTICQTSY